MSILSAQKSKKQIIGNSCGNKDVESISGNEGFHALKIL